MERPRKIWLCADDYGLAPGVNAAIRDLIVRERINATSVMVVAPSFGRSEALALNILNSGTTGVAIGLHLTLTAPFRPMTERFRPLRRGRFLPVGSALVAGMLRRYRHEPLMVEIAAQVAAFITAFDHPPDFIDGHQHVQVFPQVRDAVINVVKAVVPDAWVRQCGRVPEARGRDDRKGALLDRLSRRFVRRTEAAGVRTNPAFAGTYDFSAGLDFAALFPHFIEGMPEQGLVMCHPGYPDAELAGLDSLTFQRQREFDFFAGPAFPNVLAAHGVTLR
ncbi:MAG: ChbG/HpnK family deacetylase [Rhizobiales bacterium]|nr:ChbG/HpnK family deacetylase [Hyphomicrobiales bacterium]